jgi:myo-inositol-1(or 4)-monophosphatase
LNIQYYLRFTELCHGVRRAGSASLDLCYLACGRFDGFWEWKLQPWDTAAGWLIVTEAGGSVSDFNGDAYDPWSPRVLASNGLIKQEFIGHMGRIAAGS